MGFVLMNGINEGRFSMIHLAWVLQPSDVPIATSEPFTPPNGRGMLQEEIHLKNFPKKKRTWKDLGSYINFVDLELSQLSASNMHVNVQHV